MKVNQKLFGIDLCKGKYLSFFYLYSHLYSPVNTGSNHVLLYLLIFLLTLLFYISLLCLSTSWISQRVWQFDSWQ